jgi:hypothetical protein
MGAIGVSMGQQTQFENAEAGDWFKDAIGVTDFVKVTEVNTTFGDRVSLETENYFSNGELNGSSSFMEPEFNDRMTPIDEPDFN